MDTSVVVALISGMFSVVSALGAVFLKDFLDTRRLQMLEVPQPQSSPDERPPPQERPARPTVGRSWTRPAAIVVGSFVFGMATRALRPLFPGPAHWESLVALALLILAALTLSIYHRKGAFQLPYQLEILALWSGWASGWSLIHGGVWGDLLAVTIPWWLGCAVVGGLIVSVRNPARGSPRAS